MKKIISLCLLILLVFSCQSVYKNDLAYSYDSEKHGWLVTGFATDQDSERALKIPAIVYETNQPVVGIADNAFKDSKLSSLTLNKNITFIGKSAFENSSLKGDLDLKDVKVVSERAFYNTNLNTLIIPTTLQTMKRHAVVPSPAVKSTFKVKLDLYGVFEEKVPEKNQDLSYSFATDWTILDRYANANSQVVFKSKENSVISLNTIILAENKDLTINGEGDTDSSLNTTKFLITATYTPENATNSNDIVFNIESLPKENLAAISVDNGKSYLVIDNTLFTDQEMRDELLYNGVKISAKMKENPKINQVVNPISNSFQIKRPLTTSLKVIDENTQNETLHLDITYDINTQSYAEKTFKVVKYPKFSTFKSGNNVEFRLKDKDGVLIPGTHSIKYTKDYIHESDNLTITADIKDAIKNTKIEIVDGLTTLAETLNLSFNKYPVKDRAELKKIINDFWQKDIANNKRLYINYSKGDIYLENPDPTSMWMTSLGVIVDVNQLDIKNVTNLNNIQNDQLFYNIRNQFYPTPDNNFPILLFSTWDTSNVTTMQELLKNYSFYARIAKIIPQASIENWDVSKVENMSGLFQHQGHHEGLKIAKDEIVNLSKWHTDSLKDASHMFEFANAKFVGIEDLNVSSLEKANYMFNNPLNISSGNAMELNLGKWNTSKLKEATRMFANQSNIKGLENWNVSSLENADYMFEGFIDRGSNTLNIENWNTSSLITTQGMFKDNYNFNINLSNWNMSNVKDTSRMFLRNSAFNNAGQPLNWNTSNVRNMNEMFKGATAFNVPIGNWNVSNVQSMRSMFEEASNFNQPLHHWRTKSLVNTSNMFAKAIAFNQDLVMSPIQSNSTEYYWDTRSIKFASKMFYGATSFNGRLKDWKLFNLLDFSEILRDASSFNNDSPASWGDSIAKSVTTPNLLQNAKGAFRGTKLNDVNLNDLRIPKYIFNNKKYEGILYQTPLAIMLWPSSYIGSLLDATVVRKAY